MILIAKVRTSASKKINLMALIRILTISSTTFEKMKEKFDGFRQTAGFSLGLDDMEGDKYRGTKQ